MFHFIYILYKNTFLHFPLTYSHITNFSSVFLFLSLRFVVTRLSIGRYVSTSVGSAVSASLVLHRGDMCNGDAICATALHTC